MIRICLSLSEEFIIGQIRVICRSAERRASHLFFYKVIHRVIHRLWTVGNAVGRGAKGHPQVLNTTADIHILPQKKFALK